jgi:hypothetical protein
VGDFISYSFLLGSPIVETVGLPILYKDGYCQRQVEVTKLFLLKISKDDMAKNPIKNAKSQSEKFITAASRAGCDDDEDAFDGKLKRIAKAAPKPMPKKAGKK